MTAGSSCDNIDNTIAVIYADPEVKLLFVYELVGKEFLNGHSIGVVASYFKYFLLAQVGGGIPGQPFSVASFFVILSAELALVPPFFNIFQHRQSYPVPIERYFAFLGYSRVKVVEYPVLFRCQSAFFKKTAHYPNVPICRPALVEHLCPHIRA